MRNVSGNRDKWRDLRDVRLTRFGDGLEMGNEVSIIPRFLPHKGDGWWLFTISPGTRRRGWVVGKMNSVLHMLRLRWKHPVSMNTQGWSQSERSGLLTYSWESLMYG